MKKTQLGLKDEISHSGNSFIEDVNKTVTRPCCKHLKKKFIK